MIPVENHHGLHLPEAGLWLDPRDSKDVAFVSHAHADHFARHQRVICSETSGILIRARYQLAESRLEALPFHGVTELNGHRLRLLPAGHIRGSAMLHITRLKDGASLLYTGDFKTRKGRTAEPVVFQQADLLILETTFALPRFVFPPALEIEAALLRFVHTAFQDGDVPVLLGYSLGKAQEALALLHEHGIPCLLHPAVAEMTAACRATGLLNLPEPRTLQSPASNPQSSIPPGTAIIAPPNAVRSKLIRSIPRRRTAMLSGWALTPGANYRYRTDEAIPLSDHADHPGLLECIQRVRPKRILTVHGYAREFAAELRQKGHDAWSAHGHDQLELPIAAGTGSSLSSTRTSASARHSRPICPLADFTDLCRLVGETHSRLEKIQILAAYFKSLAPATVRPLTNSPSSLEFEFWNLNLSLASTWLAGRALPRHSGTIQMGPATLRRSLLQLPGVREERYREISLTQNDAARTARLVLEEIHLAPEAPDLPALGSFLQSLACRSGSIARIELLAARLRTLHPAESETLVKLLTGDLRIGLKEGLVEDALAEAFAADPDAVRHAHMLTGDLGETAVLAREGKLDQASLRPFVPIKLMLASPEPDAAAIRERHDFPSLWLEAKFDGIRAQLHKSGPDTALFSRDLRSLATEFPELLAAASAIEGDFILDGEIIAHAEGRRLTFFDLQKRLGRLNTRQSDLFPEGDTASLPPVRFIAFDLLWHNGSPLLDHELHQRHTRLLSLLPQSTIPNPQSPIQPIPVTRAASLAELEAAFKQARADGHEGLISKNPASPYSPGRRGKAWLKLKGVMPTLDCVVVAAEQGHGKRAEVLSDYTFAVRDAISGQLRIIGKAYSGLTDDEIEDLTDHFQRHTLKKERRKRHVEPNLVLEIAFDSIQRSTRHDSGLALRFPRIKAIRRDKSAADIDTLQYAHSLLA